MADKKENNKKMGINMPEKDLKPNLDYINENIEQLRKEYLYKFVLVSDKKVIGSFDTYEAAAQEGIRQFGLNGEFLIQQIMAQEPINFVMEALFD